MNKIILVGTVTKDVIFGGGNIKRPTQITIAVENEIRSDNKDEFINLIAWNETAVKVCRFGKGSYVEIEGRIAPDSYTKGEQRIYTQNLQITSIRSPRKVKEAFKSPSEELIAKNLELIEAYRASKNGYVGGNNNSSQPQQEFNPYPDNNGNGSNVNGERHTYENEENLPF
ncbi:hypothetical protein ABD87_22900 [Lysinibacillus sphaericus]|uniref:single-stranded DNA-binding protein n=1 Tax=Lysinibacillus sphaericus TaxID=1421 RepID=UPI0018CCDFEF|nr:single-stranded DNA-binding protein [Lysinibacillus sphaericus]MBG9732277.1 hypothetical protein [Lysinibacillus sphaericus]